MSLDTKEDFYGKDVAAAIRNACDALGAPQEKLEIEVVETGTTGIFGLIRKKAHIRVLLKPDIEEVCAEVFEVANFLKAESEIEIASEPVVSIVLKKRSCVRKDKLLLRMKTMRMIFNRTMN